MKLPHPGHEDVWESSDGLSYAEGKVIGPEAPWPALVSVDAIDLQSLSEHDARCLAAWLVTLADVAHHWTRSHLTSSAAAANLPPPTQG